jgi:outer membrane protein TolC
MSARHRVLVLLAMAAGADRAAAQSFAAAGDTIRLGALQAAALARDPRGRQLELLTVQSNLRRRTLETDRRPIVSAESQIQYQSDVARLPVVSPGALAPPSPPHDTYDARLVAQHRLYDPSLGPRRAVEDAQLADAQARVRTAINGLRQGVNDAFFAALRAQSQIAELETTITDLEAQLRVASARVREGAALPSEEFAVRAELLRRRQLVSEMDANRRAALDVLGQLTGSTLTPTVAFGLPDLEQEVARVRRDTGSTAQARGRPEFAQFARARELLQRQEQVRVAQEKPRVSAFGRIGYGQPGLNPLGQRFDAYWLGGIQAQWTPWNWGAADRDREQLALQRQIVSTEEAAFAEGLRRAVAQDLAAIDRLEASLAVDDEIIALRERIARETAVLSARITRASRAVDLAQARARYLTTLGIEVR